MIKYNLKCQNNHEFESWFSNSDEFEKLNKKKLLECIYCASKIIEKNIMAPMLSNIKNKNNQIKFDNKDLRNNKENLLQLRKFVEKNFEYVGKDFSRKVREVYYDKKDNKTFYGTTTTEERKELSDEGIDLFSIPWVSKDN
tara:strand:+ start:104 stop:526 length:423 start_codon:yes stop_codon:yes gene_type:complete